MQQTLDELDFERGLCGACSRGDLARVQELLVRRERDPNERDTSDYTPLHYAARQGHEQVCALLLGKRAAVDATAGEADRGGRTESQARRGSGSMTELTTCNVKGLLPWQLATNPEVCALLRPALPGSQLAL